MTYKHKTVRLIISQPRLGHVSEWVISVEDLLAFGEKVRAAAKVTEQPDAPLVPGEDACRFCKAKATCPALDALVSSETGIALDAADFADLDTPVPPSEPATLASKLKIIPIIEDWCKAIRARVEQELLAGKTVPGFKLVQGRQGPRKWADAVEAEAVLKAMKLSIGEMYNLSVISPTVAEKRTLPWMDDEGTQHPPAIGPRQWKKVAPLITRSEGSLSVAPESDKRPAVQVAADTDDFEDLTGAPESADASDLI